MSLSLNIGTMQYKDNSQWEPLVFAGNVNISSLAEQFSTSETYNVGDYVLYDGKLYRCTTAISTTGDWDSSDWTETRVGTELEILKYNEIFNLIYPVGSIYQSTSSTSPASLFGGSWEQIKDKFLLSAGDTYIAGGTGGSATKNLQHKHTTSGHKLVESELPNITGSFSNRRWFTGAGILNLSGKFSTSYAGSNANAYVADSGNAGSPQKISLSFGSNGSHSHGDTGNELGTAQDIMPPYLTVYVWQRIA